MPTYQRIAEDIEARIAAATPGADWSPGYKLPPPQALAEMYEALWADEGIEVSPQTVRRSTDTLQVRGVLVGRQGVGVFVARTKPRASE